MADSGSAVQLIVSQRPLALRMNVFASLVEALKCYSKPCDWRDRFVDYHRVGSQVRATNGNSIASKCPDHEWLFAVSEIGPEKIRYFRFDFLPLFKTNDWKLTSGCDFNMCAGDEPNWLDKFTENLAFGLCRPGSGTADDGSTTAIVFRALLCCSGGFLYNGFVNNAKSLSKNCSPQSQIGRNTKC